MLITSTLQLGILRYCNNEQKCLIMERYFLRIKMTTVCPKCKYMRKSTDMQPNYECPACGVIYDKYIQYQKNIQSQQNIHQVDNGHYQVKSGDTRLKIEYHLSYIMVIIVVGLAIFGAMHNSYYGLQVGKWAETSGMVTSAYIGHDKSKTAHVTYEYAVNRRSYQNDQINFDSLHIDSEAELERYPIGLVSVFYDPANSVLDQKTYLLTNCIYLIVLTIIMVIFVYFYLNGDYKDWRKFLKKS